VVAEKCDAKYTLKQRMVYFPTIQVGGRLATMYKGQVNASISLYDVQTTQSHK